MHSRRTFLKASTLLCTSSLMPSAKAQERGATVRFVTGFPPGGLTDVIARNLANGLNKLPLGYNCIVDPHTGASGIIAADIVRTGSRDGTNFLITPANVFTLIPHVRKVKFNPLADFVPVNSVFTFAYCISVGPAVPSSVTTLKAYLAWAKANPSKATFAGVVGAPQHLLGLELSKMSNTPMTLIPYQGGGPLMVQDVLRGDVPAVIQVTADALQWQGPDKLRTLATFTRERNSFLPSVPTIGEAGYPQLAAEEWGAVFAPKGTPQTVIDRWAEAIRSVTNQPTFKTALATMASVPTLTSGQDTARIMKSDSAFWEQVVSSTGVNLQ